MKKALILLCVLCLCACDKKPEDLKQPDLSSKSDPGDLSLSVATATVPADGKPYTEITLTLSQSLAEKYSSAVFEISPVGKFSNGTTTLTVPIDVSRSAKAHILSSTAGLATIKVSAGRHVATGNITFTSAALPEETLKLALLGAEVPGDNYSEAEVIAVCSPTLNKQITFSCDKGSFYNNTTSYSVPSSFNDTIRTFIRHNKAERVKVSVTMDGGYSKELYVNFLPSWPDQIVVKPSQYMLPPLYASNLSISAKLLKAAGDVHEGLIVTFTDSSASGSVGTFLNVTRSNASAEAFADYRIQDTTFRGNLYLKATIRTTQGTIAGYSKIMVKP